MKELMNVQGVSCYEENGTAYLRLEDVARGLGFTQVKNGTEYVRWETVTKYLDEIGFPNKLGKEIGVQTSAHDGYIPENIFYRLAMKAKNETAEKFQALVADEIIPSIRKHGAYMTQDTIDKILSDPDTIIQLATQLKEERQKRTMLEAKAQEDAPKVEFFDAVADSKTAIPMGEVAKILDRNIGRNKLFAILRKKKILMGNNVPYQRFVDEGYFRVIETKYTKPNGDVCINVKTLVLQKGVDYIRKVLRKK